MTGCSVTYGEIRDAQIADYAPGCRPGAALALASLEPAAWMTLVHARNIPAVVHLIQNGLTPAGRR